MNKIWQTIKPLLDMLWRWFEKIVVLLGGRTIAMLATALLVTLLSVIYSDSWIQSLDQQGETIGQIRTNIINLHRLKTDLYKAESAQRGYLFTKRQAYITPFNEALGAARDNIANIETAIIHTFTGNEQIEGREWLKAISASLEAKAAEMKVTLSLAKNGKTLEARQVVNLDDGLIEMNKFMDFTDSLIKNQNMRLNDKEKERQHTISIARLSIVGGALIIIFLVVMVIKQLLAELAIKSQLQLQVASENKRYEVKLRQQTRLLSSLALDYQADVERERQKLSRELHDELGSIFTATKMDIAWVIKKVAASAPDIAEKLKKTSSYVDQGIQFQRHIVQELHPAMLTTFGFWPALNSLINDAAERNDWQLTLNLPNENTKLNETISLVAYRIVQETLNNTNKYAKASAVSVDVIVDEQYVKLEIQDNGIGMDTKLQKEKTHGLAGMRHRVLAIGGHFEINSEPGKGVLTRALIPIDFEATQA